MPDKLFAEITNAARIRNLARSEIVRERLWNNALANQLSTASLWSRMEDLLNPTDSLPMAL